MDDPRIHPDFREWLEARRSIYHAFGLDYIYHLINEEIDRRRPNS